MTDHEIVETMRNNGGSFAQALAQAWLKGDPINRCKIQDTWPDLWAQYAELAALIQADRRRKEATA